MVRETQKMQIYDLLKERIESGFYSPGSRLPKEIELASELNISRITLRPALELLEMEKLISRVKGKGTFVHDPRDIRTRILVIVYGEKFHRIDSASDPFLYIMPCIQAAAARMNVTADDPDPIAKYAAKELQDHFALACGSTPEIVKESQYKSGPAIMVGGTSAAKKYGIDPGMLAPETLVVARLKDVIVLSGGDNPAIPPDMVSGRAFVPVGALYAAYEFLEKKRGLPLVLAGETRNIHPESQKSGSPEALYHFSSPV